ncbi:hypothetical protein RSJ42_15170 [Methanosarcina hadiensis]|uniref:hypothetical protein n=1 Tax=Methanosarcina hadiensis TaxID=3078083 RepID=UPI0039772B33
MNPEGVTFVRLFSTYLQASGSRKKLKLLLYLPLFISLIALPVTAAANNWELVPENPVVGDMVEIRGANFTGETADVLVSFEKEVRVSEGRYEYLLENVEISPGFKNSFKVEAKGADDLNVRVKMVLWVSRSAKAEGGVAAVSQSYVPPGTYQIRIDGKSNASFVKLKITGLQQVKVESGKLSYKYNTESIPSGGFEIKVRNVTKHITLQPAENQTSNITESGKKENSNRGFSGNWKVRDMLIGLTGLVLLLLYLRTKKDRG